MSLTKQIAAPMIAMTLSCHQASASKPKANGRPIAGRFEQAGTPRDIAEIDLPSGRWLLIPHYGMRVDTGKIGLAVFSLSMTPHTIEKMRVAQTQGDALYGNPTVVFSDKPGKWYLVGSVINDGNVNVDIETTGIFAVGI